MDWSFTDEQEQIAALTRDILVRELTEERMRGFEASDDAIDRPLYEQLAKSGVIGIAVAEGVGGGGLGLIELCRVLTEVGRAVAPAPVLETAVAAMTLAEFGKPEQLEVVRAALAGDKVLTIALAEDLNLDLVHPTTRAVAKDEDWSITGAKTTVPAGTVADLLLVSAAFGEDGVGLFPVPTDRDGVTVTPQTVTNARTEALVEFDDARIHAFDHLSGSTPLRYAIDHLTVGLCALQLGVCERALELTADYSKQRQQFDRPIATFQAVGQRLADAYIDVQAIRLTLWEAAWRLAEGLECSTELATAKFWAADAGHRVAHTAVHIHGGVGIDLDYHLNRYFVAAKRIEFALGGASEHLVRVGRALADPGL